MRGDVGRRIMGKRFVGARQMRSLDVSVRWRAGCRAVMGENAGWSWFGLAVFVAGVQSKFTQVVRASMRSGCAVDWRQTL